MTGTVDWSTLLWIVGAISGAFIAGAVVVWRVVSWSSAELTKRDTALELHQKETSLAVQAAAASAKMADEIRGREVAEFKLHAAEHFVTKDGLADALHGVQTSIDRLSDLLNQLLVQAAGNPPLAPNPARRGTRGAS